MDLAVVVVDYNAGEYLTACLRSVFEHTGGAEIEVVVVDNASRDLSGRIAKDAFPQIELIETGENRGFAAGVNVGLRATTAPYVFVLNPDAEVWEGTLAFSGAGTLSLPSITFTQALRARIENDSLLFKVRAVSQQIHDRQRSLSTE